MVLRRAAVQAGAKKMRKGAARALLYFRKSSPLMRRCVQCHRPDAEDQPFPSPAVLSAADLPPDAYLQDAEIRGKSITAPPFRTIWRSRIVEFADAAAALHAKRSKGYSATRDGWEDRQNRLDTEPPPLRTMWSPIRNENAPRPSLAQSLRLSIP